MEFFDIIYLIVVDKEWNVISMIYIVNGSFGVGVVVVGIGILLNNEMDDFAVVFEV